MKKVLFFLCFILLSFLIKAQYDIDLIKNCDNIYYAQLIKKDKKQDNTIICEIKIFKKWSILTNNINSIETIYYDYDIIYKYISIDSFFIFFCKNNLCVETIYITNRNIFQIINYKLDFYFNFYNINCFFNNDPLLTNCESKFLNYLILKDSSLNSQNIDLTNKRVLFTTDISIISKDLWYKKYAILNHDMQIIELNENEKNIYKYDYIIASYLKRILNEKWKIKILKQIKI